MKKLFSTADPQQMARLHRYFTHQQVPVTVNERGDTLELWCTQTSYYALAKQLMDEYRADPEVVDRHFASTLPPTSRATKSSSMLGSFGQNLWQQAGWVTRAIGLLVIAVYLLLQTPLAESVFAWLRISDYFDTIPWAQGWRLFTPMLLHFSVMHFLFNLFWWWYLGSRIEAQTGRRMNGSVVLLLLVLFTSVVANLAQFYSSGPYFGGLSGVVYGLFGYCALVAFGQPRHPLYLPPGLLVFMLAWLALGYTDLLWVQVANEAHLAGLLAGVAAAVVVKGANGGGRRIP